MAFPKQLLADHEKIVFDLKPHWVALIPSVLWSIVFLAASVLAYNFVYNLDGSYDWWEIAITVALLLGWYLLAVLPFLRWQFTHFVLTSDRLITRAGVVAKHSKEIPLERINDVAFSQTMIERALGAGDLMIESAGERGQNQIRNVRRPEQVQLMIYKETESNNNRMMRPPSGAPVQASIPEQIEALSRLKDQGVISETEFETKKAELLKRL
jgi:uncharacterized membrane protein YdbT with pleckstrin-like domain